RGSLEHKQSKLWGAAGAFAIKRPLYALVIVAVIVVPLILSYNGKLSFDSMKELGNNYDSVKGFNLITESFAPGEAMPTNIVLAAAEPLDTPEGLAMIERVSAEVAKVNNVAKVRSATRPLGEKLAELSVANQMGTLADGLSKSKDGVDQIKTGLSNAQQSIAESQPKLVASVAQLQQLSAGTMQLKNGVDQLQQGLSRIAQGLDQGTSGLGQISDNMGKLQENAAQLADAAAKLSAGYNRLGDNLAQVTAGYGQIGQNAQALVQALKSAEPLFDVLKGKYPDLETDRDFAALQAAVGKSQEGADALAAAAAKLNDSLQLLNSSLQTANKQFAAAASGEAQLTAGLAKVNEAIKELQAGLQQAAAGERQAVDKLPGMSQGLGQIASGQQQFSQGFAALAGQLGDLSSGLGKSADGLGEISHGLEQARSYAAQVAADQDEAGINIPQEAVTDKQMQSVYDMFMSADRTVTTFNVILRTNPYSEESMDTIKPIQEAVQRALQGTKYENAQFGIDGVTGMNADLRQVSHDDYNRTVVLMLIAISLILILLLRSIIMPLYLMAGLITCYFASLAVNQLIFVNLLGNPGTNWTIPFFAFVILMALGVDYSIFLMDRFNEHRGESVGDAILLAMKNMGTVIISAAIILAGTFAAMLPSGVLSLLQIATSVLTGLLLYALFILPLFVPVMVRLFGQQNWWPFIGKRQ
ncbi:MAG TPA: MMPL family transporter, partial [Bacilli bacterium]